MKIMKRRLPFILALFMLCVFCTFALTACGNTDHAVTGKPTSDSKETSGNTEHTPTAKSGRILVACFSATGNTKRAAEYAAEYLHADFYEILPETPYSAADLNYNDPDSRVSKENSDASARPKIANAVENMAQYDIVIIAHPIWWGQAPKIIYTFLESYDFGGKALTTMCTSASSPLGSSADNLKKLTDGSVRWPDSRRFSSGASPDEVIAWLDGIGLKPSESYK